MAEYQGIDVTYTQNRELSWLKFNERVLEEAADPMVPLYERLKFVSIFTSNLDEFFMIRVGSIGDLALVRKDDIDNKTGETPAQQLEDIFREMPRLYAKRDMVFSRVEGMLREYGICNLEIKELAKPEKKFLEKYYQQEIQPILSPQIIDRHHPFPHFENMQLYVLLVLSKKKEKEKEKPVIAVIPVPDALPKIVALPGSAVRYVLVEKLVSEFADKEFEKYSVIGKSIITVTRNGDLSLDENDDQFDTEEDYRQHMKKVLKKRKRLAPVRLEHQGQLHPALFQRLLEQLQIKANQVYESKAPLNMSYIFGLQEQFSVLSSGARQKITYPPFAPQPSPYVVKGEPMLWQLQRGDILLSFPYEQMDPFLNLLKESASDPEVLSIRVTIYRLASSSRMADALVEAAENGKDVTVLMELRARFDEQNNIRWAEVFENAGCKVIYGFDNFKVHSKICQITRRSAAGGVEHITQIGTGNYNEKTARLYTDLSLITMNQKIGEDAALFFRNMSISNLEEDYEHLLVSPHCLKPGLIRLIDREIQKAKSGGSGRVLMKMNSLTDRDMIDKLAEASQAGVKIELLIRGICCLRPGVAGKTENITVRSIVGRFLEHSRIFCFGEGDDLEMFIGSADLMTRNTIRRVEIACPVYSPEIRQRIARMLEIYWKDNEKARLLQSDGSYLRVENSGGASVDAQAVFMENAVKHAEKVKVYQPQAEPVRNKDISLGKKIVRQWRRFFSQKDSDK